MSILFEYVFDKIKEFSNITGDKSKFLKED